MQCGIACLSMISNYYGQAYTLDYFSALCYATTEGVSLLSLKEAANAICIATECVKTTIEDLSNEQLPCILHWNQKHFVILYAISKDNNYFFIADPAKGKIRYNYTEFKKHWISTSSNNLEKGIAMFFHKTDKFSKSSIKKTNNNSFIFYCLI